MKISIRVSIIIFMTLFFVTSLASTALAAERWRCRNYDLEITCNSGKCESQDSFTPMDVSFSDSRTMNVCAYSGCWQGRGNVFKSENFTVIAGHNLRFSTAQDSEAMNQNIVIAIDTDDKVATLKAGSFAHPLTCEEDKEAE